LEERQVTADVCAGSRVADVPRLEQRGKPAARKPEAPARAASAGWLVPAGLILLSIVPIVAGAFRLTQLGGAQIFVGDLQSLDAIQLALPFERGRNDALDTVVDAVRERFGSGALVRAALLGRDQGWSAPMPPDWGRLLVPAGGRRATSSLGM
jgi:hypothetical protein